MRDLSWQWGRLRHFFKIAFIIFPTLIGVKMVFGSGWRVRSSLPGRVAQCGYGFLTGLVSSLVGVSGGSVSNAVLTLYGQPIQHAIATSAGIGVPITIVGMIGYVLAGWRPYGQNIGTAEAPVLHRAIELTGAQSWGDG